MTKITLTLPNDLAQAIRQAANDQDRTVSTVVRRALKQALASKSQPKKQKEASK